MRVQIENAWSPVSSQDVAMWSHPSPRLLPMPVLRASCSCMGTAGWSSFCPLVTLNSLALRLTGLRDEVWVYSSTDQMGKTCSLLFALQGLA
jgi:hypothetical protein